MRELHLFSGCGGGVLGGMLLGHTTVCAVEISEYRRKVLLQRQRDGILPRFPIWDDVTTFDGRPWRGRVDVVAGGFPCQDISSAGKGAGIKGAKSGLWDEMARIIGEVGPRVVFVENSPMLVSRGLGQVLGDLAQMGFHAEWGVFSCADAAWIDGAPIADHERERLWILALSNSEIERCSKARGLRREQSSKRFGGICEEVSNPHEVGRDEMESHDARGENIERTNSETCECDTKRDGRNRWWASEPGVHGVVDGVASRVDRLEAIGDGQVPAVAALAWRTLLSRISSCDSKTQ